MEQKITDALNEIIDERMFQANTAVAEELAKRNATDTELLDFVIKVIFGEAGEVSEEQMQILQAIEVSWSLMRRFSQAMALPAVLDPRSILTAARKGHIAGVAKMKEKNEEKQ